MKACSQFSFLGSNLAVLALSLFLSACEGNDPKRIQGEAFGSEYELRSSKKMGRERKDSIKALLERIQGAASLLEENSSLQEFNSSRDGIILKGKKGVHLKRLFEKARKAHRMSGGNFDPTVAPLVEFWGRDAELMRSTSEAGSRVDSLLGFVGLEKVELLRKGGKGYLKKSDQRVEMDLSGVVKGYVLDQLGKSLKGVSDEFLMMRIGDKYLIHGHPSKDHWKVPIGYPNKSLRNKRVAWLFIQRDTAAIVTSGNFQKFYTKKGEKYSYTIDPDDGRPTENRLLSVTVIAKSAAFADAMATAYMVMGLKKAKRHASAHKRIEAFFIGTDPDGKILTKATQGVKFSNASGPHRLYLP